MALQARHAAAVASSDAHALDTVSTKFEEAGFLLSAADSTAQAAPLHDHTGQRRRSLESVTRARRLAAECGGATTQRSSRSSRFDVTFQAPRMIHRQVTTTF
ncbi:MAG: helix-turn-helix transcriptional regulator [Mycobacterium sp.]|nr:helix-turn-helix transcriptional regulator [Mycobacterium sp.]